MSDWDRYYLLDSELGRLRLEAENTQARLADAFSRYDYSAQAAANRDLSRLENRIVQLEGTKDQWDAAIQQQQYAQQYTPQRAMTAEEMISALPDLTEDERSWLRKHPEAITNPANQKRLEVAFIDSQAQGIERGSPEYFAHFDSRLGYDGDQASGARSSRQNNRHMPRAIVQAEASAKALGVDLTAREAAKLAGISENEYAKAAQEVAAQGLFDREKSLTVQR